jgi:periplasmic protein TonB
MRRFDFSAGEMNLTYTLILALLIHGVVILAVDFAPPAPLPDSRTQSLEVTVAAQADAQAPEQADFFAAANQAGGGGSDAAAKPTLGPELPAEAEMRGDDAPLPSPDEARETAETQATAETPRLTISIPSWYSIDAVIEEILPQGAQATPAELLANLSEEIVELEAELDDETRTLAKIGRREAITAATKKHLYAAYMEQWRRRVEEVGNLNYPRGASGSVIVHIAVRADGSLEQARILKPSSSSLVNESALNIARMAAPFPPFPANVREKTDILDIIRTWHFQQDGHALELDATATRP